MVDNYEGVVKKELFKADLKALTSQIREHESLLKLKRRWLMDLPLSTREQKRIDEILPPNDQIMPESFLREDDVSYDDIRTCIETAFGAHNSGNESYCVQAEARVLNSQLGFQDIFYLLDAMTNKGLCSFVKILTGGLIKFEKTNWSMKKSIKELLPKVIADKNAISETKLKKVFQLLEDPKNFRGNQMVRSIASEAYHAAALKVLDGLEDFPSRTLSAMHRKLRGVRGYIPSLQSPRIGQRRNDLINLVKKRCKEMLSDIREANELAEQLVGALGVACLTLKLMMNCPDVRDLRKFSPEIEALQNDIAKAIHLLNDKREVSLVELKKVQLLLDPNSELSIRSLRMGVRHLLTEYLYECSDMDKVPNCLVETLDIINRRAQLASRKKCSSFKVHSSPGELMKEVIQKEVEYVLNISAQAKEVVSNSLPKHGFDEEFANAYMEDFNGSDLCCVFDGDEQIADTCQHFEFNSYSSYGQTESIGETTPAELNSPVSPVSIHNDFKSEETTSCPATTPKYEVPDFPVEETNILCQRSRSVNGYLEVQGACDVTSMVAYRFMGHMLDKLATAEGLVLCEGDRLYLRSYSSVSEDSEEYPLTSLASKFSEM